MGRIEQTLALMHSWGYAPTTEGLAANLLGGTISAADIDRAVRGLPHVRTDGPIVYLLGHEDLVVPSRDRVVSHRRLNGAANSIARAYTRDLVRTCPFVECVAMAGSVASGGFAKGDDIDFDLFVEPGTKYTTYLIANLIGLRYAWRYRHRELAGERTTPFLPKLACVNVVWPSDQTRPFARQDAGLAFELARCVPLHGAHRFERAISDNGWITKFLPQLSERRWPEPDPEVSLNAIGRALRGTARHPALRWMVEAASRGLSWAMYSFVQGVKRRNLASRQRIEFLRRVKYPYEVFQD